MKDQIGYDPIADGKKQSREAADREAAQRAAADRGRGNKFGPGQGASDMHGVAVKRVVTGKD